MAVKGKSLEENHTVPEGLFHIKTLLADLEQFEPQIRTYKDVKRMCVLFIERLAIVYVPTEASLLKEYNKDWLNFGMVLERIIRNSEQFEQILMACLQTLYTIIVKNEKTSAAAGIIFNIYDESLMPKIIKTMLSNSVNCDIDNDIKKVINKLCVWLRTHSGYTNLNRCIMAMFEALRDLKKYNLLLEIACEIIVQLFISLIIPIIRPRVIPVVLYILSAAQSQKVFSLVAPRIPKVIERIENTLAKGDETDENGLHNLIDVISALMMQYPDDSMYKETEKILSRYTVLYKYQTSSEIQPWQPPTKIATKTTTKLSTRDPKMPIGLVNLGNTCYMNSVLQALLLTKQFTHDILKLNLPSRVISIMQQLISLLLHSVRPEIEPRNVLRTLPQNFHHGHQQDSFEYLGYILDQLYEEEKKCILNANSVKAQNELNNNCDKKTVIQNGHGVENHNNGAASVDDMGMEVDSTNDVISDVQITIENEHGNRIEGDQSKEAQSSVMAEKVTMNNTGTHNGNGKGNEAHPQPAHHHIEESSSIINTIIQKSFAGKMSVIYKCLECSTESKNVDNFCDLQLSLPIMSPPPPKCTTQSLLDAYFSKEHLTDDDKYYCEKCKMLRDGERNICINAGPSNLILVIKHFKYDRKFHIRRKLMQKVAHDAVVRLNTFNDMGDCVELVYKLYAAIVHSGMNIDSGHYYTIGAYGDKWYKFNDNHISSTTLDELHDLNSLNTPYILFYELVKSTEKMDTITSRPSSPVENNSSSATLDIQSLTPISSKYKWPPNLDELPITLQEYVYQDNRAYEAAWENSNSDNIRNHYNEQRKSDRDPDPPNSCGGNMIISSNPMIK